jgi:Clostridium epsilon toxin ETX/Bacillus mosquitocidal toxin MTX2
MPNSSNLGRLRNISYDSQSASGSSDYIGLEKLPTCGPNQLYNCAYAAFTTPKNVAAGRYTGGHGWQFRRYSVNFSDANNAVVVFKPSNAKQTCGLTEDGLKAYVSANFAGAMAAHGSDVTMYSASGPKMLSDYPGWNNNLKYGGLFVKDWGINGQNGLPNFDVAANSVSVKFDDDLKNQVGNIYLASNTTQTTNPYDPPQNFLTGSFSQTITDTASSTSSTSWSNTVGGSVTATATVTAGVDPEPTFTRSMSVNVNYSHTASEDRSKTCSTSEAVTISAPSQNFTVPGHTGAVFTWTLYATSGDMGYTFSAPLQNNLFTTGVMGGRLVAAIDEWQNPGSYQAYDSDIVTVQPIRFSTSLYNILQPVNGQVLPSGLIWNAEKKQFILHGAGTVHVKLGTKLVLQLDLYPLNKDGTINFNVKPKTSKLNIPIKVKPSVSLRSQ